MRRISTSALVPGMVTAEDVYSLNNTLILPKGLILTDKAITKLDFYSIINIKIQDRVVTTSENIEAGTASYTERLKKTPEFQIYQKIFHKNTETLRNVIDDLALNNGIVKEEELLACTQDLVPTDGNFVNVFDMLHSMRDNDDVTYTHSMNVALICNVFARWLRMNAEEVRLATLCGMLHDIGKLTVPQNIIKKPGRLSVREMNAIKAHPSEGYQLLLPLPLDDHVKNAALMHHERLDGSGYPLGLSGNRIDPYAQIIAIADIYDAMTSARIYRGSLCPFKAIEIFESEGYQKYNPRFFLTFLENIVDTYMQYRVRLSNGQEGEVIFINRHKLSRPVIKVGSTYVDLSKELHLTIEALI